MTKHDDTPIINDDGDTVNLDDLRQDDRDQLGLDSQEDDEPM